MGRRNLYYIYPRDKQGKYTGHTVAVTVKDNAIFHGIALCSEKDHFCKAEGRKLALERAEDSYKRHKERTEKSQ